MAAILCNEPDADRVVSIVAADTLVAPQLISFEVACVYLKKMRRYRCGDDRFLAAFQLIDQLDIDTTLVDFADMIELANDRGLAVHDACYLWLARLLKCESVTLDKKLSAGSRR